jgi:hypothetical protein
VTYSAAIQYRAACPRCGDDVLWRQILDLRGTDSYSLEGCQCPDTQGEA